MKKELCIGFYLVVVWFAAILPAHAQPSKTQIFLVFNQPKYFPGDTAFFRGQLTTPDHKPVAGKKVVNLKLAINEEVFLYNRVLFQNGLCACQLYLPKDLSSGVYSLVAYTDENPTVGIQIPFIISSEKEIRFSDQEKSKYFSHDTLFTVKNLPRVKITIEKPLYGVRQQVNVQLNLIDSVSKPLPVDYAVSVVHHNLFQDTPWQSIVQQTNQDAFSLPALTDFNSAKSLKKTPHYFKGKALLDSIPVAQRDSIFITFYFRKNDFIYGLYADDQGNFEFPLFKEFGDEEMFYTLSRRGVILNNIKIITDQPGMLKAGQITSSKSEKSDPYFKLAKERAATSRSYNYYLAESNNELSEEDNWMETDYEVNVQDFEPFMDMKEMLTNIIQTVRYSSRKSGESVRVFLKDNAMYGRRDPLYVINGIMTDDTEYFLQLEPGQIEKIGVLRSKATLARFGDLGKNGIILVKTRASVEEIKGDRMLFIKGISQPVKFYSPQYKSEGQLKNRIPDLRSALYWNPQLLSGNGSAKFSFYTGDAVGFFKIRVNGIAEDGQFFSEEFLFEVQKDQ